MDPAGSSNLVPWYSVFWGLASIAFNSMSQPSGKICDAPSHVAFWLRISPVICVVDTLVMVIRIIIYSFREHSLDKATVHIITQRFVFDDPNSETFANFRHYAKARWAAFLFSVFQAVKIFGFGGLVWSKLWAAMYLFSFIVTELLVVFPQNRIPAKTDLKKGDMPKGSGEESLPYLSVLLGAIFGLYFTTNAASSIFQIGLLQCVAPVIVICGSVPFVMAAVFSYNARADPKDFLSSYVLTLVLVFFPAIFSLFWLLPASKSPSQLVNSVISMTIIVVWSLLGLRWASVTFKPVIKKSREDTKRIESALAKYFFAFNLVTVILYFKFNYDPAKTIRPAWTEWLG